MKSLRDRVYEMTNNEVYVKRYISQEEIQEICMELFEVAKIKKISEKDIDSIHKLYLNNEMFKILKDEVRIEVAKKYFIKYCFFEVVLRDLKKEILADIISLMN